MQSIPTVRSQTELGIRDRLSRPITTIRRTIFDYNGRMIDIFPMTVVFNFAMLPVVIAAIRLMNRRRGFLGWCAAVILAGAAAGLLGLTLAVLFERPAGVIRFLSYAIFLHGTIILAATAVIYRKKRLAALAALAGVMLLSLTAVRAFLLEPHWLEVNRYRIVAPKITRPLRIVVIADPQIDKIGHYEREVLRLAMAEKPDLLLFAGDYIQAFREDQQRLCREFNELLREMDIQTPLGAFAVRGNVDPLQWMEIFQDAGVRAVGETRSFDLGEVQLTCLGLRDSYRTSPVRYPPTGGRFHILLGHVPNFALGNGDADLIVAGHTHGGQLQLPWLGPVVTNSRLPRKLAHGFNVLPGGGKMIVSRGIGMERGYAPRFRFLCRPELVVVELVPGEEGATDERK